MSNDQYEAEGYIPQCLAMESGWPIKWRPGPCCLYDPDVSRWRKPIHRTCRKWASVNASGEPRRANNA